MEILLGIIFIVIGVLNLYTAVEWKWSKVFESNYFNDWLWGIVFIMGGIYTIIRAVIELFH